MRSRTGQLQASSRGTRAPAGGVLQRKCACGTHTGGGAPCSACAEKEHSLQRRAIDDHELTEVPPIVYEVLRSPGQPLDRETRAFFEPRFGHDFSDVRVHTDAKAAASARAVNASAYTVGRDIAFAHSQFAPDTDAGRHLLAHELTHTLQQGSPTRVQASGLRLAYPTGAAEREADAISEQALGPTAPRPPLLRPSASAAGARLHRKCSEHDTIEFYEASPNYCKDTSATGWLHKGEVCFREIPRRSSYHDCPPGDQVCFDKEGRCKDSPDKASPVAERSGKACQLHPRCLFEHAAKDEVLGGFWQRIGGEPYPRVQLPGEGGRKESGRGATTGDRFSHSDRRSLTAPEQSAARLVFGKSLDAAKIEVRESSVMTLPRGSYIRTLLNTVYVPPGSLNAIDTKTLIHELTHCWQYRRGMGIEVVITAGRNYEYGGEEELRKASKAGKRFAQFTTEQQGDILADYYEWHMSGKDVNAWLPFVAQVQEVDRVSTAAEWP